MRRLLTFLALLPLAAGASTPDPADYIYPVEGVDGTCSANFGEMRPGHFHSGVDIRTGGVEGKRLVAVADGYISRVHIGAGGYGRAVYLTLANGTTAVYGHLSRFRDDVEQAVREERYRRRTHALDLFYGPERWPVRQGDPVGYSGNSGASSGPHLHFEVRDTPTQRLWNPVKTGIIAPADSLPPRIVKLHYIAVDSLDGVCLHAPAESRATVREAVGRYRLADDRPVEADRKGYFVAEVTDRRNGVANRFGIWRMRMEVDGEAVFEYRQDGFTFDLSRTCDAVSCYPMQIGSRNECIRLARLGEAPGQFYPILDERGLVRTGPGQRRRIRIEAEDDCGNVSSLEFDIVGRERSFSAEADSTATVVRPASAATVTFKQTFRARIPEGGVYEALRVRPDSLPAPGGEEGVVVLSPAYRVFETATPLRKAMTLSIRTPVPSRLQPRASLAVRNDKGRLVYAGGTYADGAVEGQTFSTGEACVAADTLPPAVRPLFKPDGDFARTPELRFAASDNFSGIASWTLHIDGRWVPCDRYPMRETLVHRFDTPAERRRHEVRLTVLDDAGNTATWSGTFYR